MRHVVKEIIRPLLVIVAIPTCLLFMLVVHDFGVRKLRERSVTTSRLPDLRRVEIEPASTKAQIAQMPRVSREGMTMRRSIEQTVVA
jgi:hypothetical protein